MKLKMKSVGLTSLPEAERAYFLVQPPRGEAASLGCFISHRWTLGKVVDSLAELTKTPNKNNQTGAKKLAIFRQEGRKINLFKWYLWPKNSCLAF